MRGARACEGDSEQIIRPLVAEVDLGCIRQNVSFLNGLTPPRCMFMAVVKANAYGHGAPQVSRAALDAGADCLGVALVEEGVRLRAEGFDCPIYLLFETTATGAARAVAEELICSVYTEEYAKALSAAALEQGKTVLVHVKVDSGMHRVGIAASDAAGFCSAIESLEGLEVTGIYTHFAVADDPDNAFTRSQIDRFVEACRAAESSLGRRLLKHAANSAGVMAFPESHFDMVRVGIAMLGLHPSEKVPTVERLQPALSLRGRISLIKRVPAGEGISYGLRYSPARDATIATLPVGYADGFSRLLSGKADALISGRRWPVVGTICMDACMVDLGESDVEPAEPFVLIGADGTERITAEEVADKMGTINYEVVCMISSRVPRVFVDGERGPRDETVS